MTLVPSVSFITSRRVMFLAIGTLLRCLGRGSLWLVPTFSFDLSGFIRLVILRANGGFQVQQLVIDVIVGKVLLGLEVIDNVTH